MHGNRAAFGIYPTTELLEAGLANLKWNGFETSDISVLCPESAGTTERPDASSTATGRRLKSWLRDSVKVSIMDVGTFHVTGPLARALAGAGSDGTTGGLSGAFARMGVPEYLAGNYEGVMRTGGIIVSVNGDRPEQVQRAKIILELTGADNVTATGGEKAVARG